MAYEVMVKIDGGRACGVTAADAEALSELEGGTYRAVLTSPRGRSVSQNGVFHAFCGNIADNYDDDRVTKEAVKRILKIECGLGVPLKLLNGWRMDAMSIAFDKMPQEAFNEFMERALTKAGECFGQDLATAALAEALRLMPGDISSTRDGAAVVAAPMVGA